jgi:glycosyltransferase involved in cell wall biosynthesis
MQRSTIAACVIARDEERFIGGCLESLAPFVDEMVLVDTGSLDRTRDIAQALGARVQTFAWCDDFAAARNAAIETATADWIFMLDADERLEADSGVVLRDLPRRMPIGVHGACPRIESRTLTEASGPCSITSEVPRFFRRSADLRYTGAIHEDLVFLPDPAATRNVIVHDLRVIHYGYDSALYAARHKDERNTRLLERQTAEHPHDPRPLYFLTQQHYVMERYAEAVACGRRFLALSQGVREAFVVETYAMLLHALAELDRPAEVDATAEIAAAANLLGVAAYEALARFEERRGRLRQAVEYLHRARDLELPAGLTSKVPAGWA